jgi:ADP-ribose pyrophosphatase
MPKNKSKGSKEKILSSKYILKGHVINLRVDKVVTADGRRTTREIIEHSGAVAVVALDADNNVLLVKQYRSAIKKDLLEIPAGSIDKGEATKTTVIREMQEETGYKPRKVKFLADFYSAPGYSEEKMYLYLATDLVPSRLTAEDTAEIELVRVPVNQVKAMITSGKIQDAKSIIGLMMMLEYLKKS